MPTPSELFGLEVIGVGDVQPRRRVVGISDFLGDVRDAVGDVFGGIGDLGRQVIEQGVPIVAEAGLQRLQQEALELFGVERTRGTTVGAPPASALERRVLRGDILPSQLPGLEAAFGIEAPPGIQSPTLRRSSSVPIPFEGSGPFTPAEAAMSVDRDPQTMVLRQRAQSGVGMSAVGGVHVGSLFHQTPCGFIRPNRVSFVQDPTGKGVFFVPVKPDRFRVIGGAKVVSSRRRPR